MRSEALAPHDERGAASSPRLLELQDGSSFVDGTYQGGFPDSSTSSPLHSPRLYHEQQLLAWRDDQEDDLTRDPHPGAWLGDGTSAPAVRTVEEQTAECKRVAADYVSELLRCRAASTGAQSLGPQHKQEFVAGAAAASYVEG
ncbi:unnamed protein product [Amoebophrya sp. A120]|nr:unnamed protein product [Amoebophrya sp. A120]|eukprot:GSA120T00006476001.1